MTVSVRGIGTVGAKEPGTLVIPWGEGTREIPAFRADTAPLERFIPRRALRRIDAFSRMALLGAHLALEDAGLLGQDLGGLGIVIASAYGATGPTFDLIDSMIQDGDMCSSPIHFAGSLHNTPAAHVAIFLGAKGPSLTLSLFEGLAPAAFTAARLWLEEGRAERVLVGVVDELSDLTGYLWARSDSNAPPKEGAAFFLLSTVDGDGYGALDASAEDAFALAEALRSSRH